jgi:hypothetical protein
MESYNILFKHVLREITVISNTTSVHSFMTPVTDIRAKHELNTSQLYEAYVSTVEQILKVSLGD